MAAALTARSSKATAVTPSNLTQCFNRALASIGIAFWEEATPIGRTLTACKTRRTLEFKLADRAVRGFHSQITTLLLLQRCLGSTIFTGGITRLYQIVNVKFSVVTGREIDVRTRTRMMPSYKTRSRPEVSL